MFHRDFLAPSGSGSGSGACLPSFFSFLFSGMGCPMNSLLRMNVVETWFVAVWGLCWCIFFNHFSPTAKLAMGSLAQNSSGAIRCSCNSRFRRRFRRVPVGSGGFRRRWLMRFRRVPVQMADEVPEGSGADG